MNASAHIDLPGLTGNNPLAFLAALGLLRTVTRLWPDEAIRLAWCITSGAWSPWIEFDRKLSRDELVESLRAGLAKMSGHPVFGFADDLTLTIDEFRCICEEAVAAASSENRIYADFLAAYGSDGLSGDEKTDRIQDTALRTMSGAGHQHFLGFMRELVDVTEPSHLYAALFEPWAYRDGKPCMRWDPQDDRRYALRWREPSGDPVRTVRGANRLAIEALPLIPTAPVLRSLHTTGFVQRRREGVFFTWPIWEAPASLVTITSLLALAELQNEPLKRELLRARGIAEIYRSQRITQGKYRNFTPAMPA